MQSVAAAAGPQPFAPREQKKTVMACIRCPPKRDCGTRGVHICHKLLSEIAPNDSVEELREIDRLIGEFSAVDPSSMAFRYPEDKKGNASLPGITHINLRNVREVMSGIGNMLTGASCLVEEHLSIKGKMEAEYGSDEADPGEDWRGEW